ncbi:MAG TPA: aminoacyl-tRNA hydrolase [Bdellovibrionota bacterium]|jgi:PTH1 family peptidyl-tRNA hydrolase|nr:aminoacyl-tRNA hydrolase [Bdellovibrionota bacterium]
MKLIVGLGNPGPRYETTRHNVGWLALDRMIDDFKAEGPQKKYDGEIWRASVDGEQVLLVKPQTFMNLSGRCVGPLVQFHKCAPEDILVLHDEVDLPFGALRIKTGGGTGGHNGLKSLDASLGADKNGYHRIRIGVGKPGLLPTGAKGMDTADWVLQMFSDDELEELDKRLDDITAAARLVLKGRMGEAMNRYNQKPKGSAADADKD